MVRSTAHHAYPLLRQVMQSECNGCLTDHPSQTQHMCLMMESEEYVRFGLDKTLTLVDWGKVKSTFWKSINVNLMLKCGPCYDKEEFFQKLFEEWHWRNLLVSLLVQKHQGF